MADLALAAWAAPRAWPSAPPVALALPVAAALMAIGAGGIARCASGEARASQS
jgi:hypothetical protein